VFVKNALAPPAGDHNMLIINQVMAIRKFSENTNRLILNRLVIRVK